MEGKELASKIPDTPELVELRGLLLSENFTLLHYAERPELQITLYGKYPATACIHGEPHEPAVRRIDSSEASQIVVRPENAETVARFLPNWVSEAATVHTLQGNEVPDLIFADIAELKPQDDLSDLPDEFREEIAAAVQRTTVIAKFREGKPVSFCYSRRETETLWALSVDTLQDHKNLGYGKECSVYMIRKMSEMGKRPVWICYDENLASMRLARKLAFRPHEKHILFRRPES